MNLAQTSKKLKINRTDATPIVTNDDIHILVALGQGYKLRYRIEINSHYWQRYGTKTA